MDNILYGTNIVNAIQLIRIKKNQRPYGTLTHMESPKWTTFCMKRIRLIQPLLYNSLSIIYKNKKIIGW